MVAFSPHGAQAQSGPRTIDLELDRFGQTPPDSLPPAPRAGDRVRVVFHPSRVVRLTSLDIPKAATVDTRWGAQSHFFVYPQDPGLLYDLPLTMMPSVHPGFTDVYVMAAGDLRLRATRLSQTELNDSITADSRPGWDAYQTRLVGRCYPATAADVLGRSEAGAGANAAHALRQAETAASDSRVLQVFRDVPMTVDATKPFVQLELVQAQSSKAGCANAASLATGATYITHAFVIARVTPDFANAALVYSARAGGEQRRDSVAFTTLNQAAGTLQATTPALDPSTLAYQVCYAVAEGSGLRRLLGNALPSSCVPPRSGELRVIEGLPGAVRLQPGIVAVNGWRDVRLTANMLIIMDRESYFRVRERPRFIGGYLNPTVGLQFGGTDSQLVLLMGAHLRLVDEAGLVAGFRFGNERNAPYRLDQNVYLGFALDPNILSNLRSAPAQ